jgi:hypothetical protein
MKLCTKIAGMFFLILLTASSAGQDSNCTISKTLPVKKGTTLRLSNKYGDVNVITGKYDSLAVCARITIIQDDDALIRKNLKLIAISIDKIKDTVYISTKYDKKFFSDASRLGRKSFSVDYLIKIPAYLDLNISDEFGNVSVEELSGTLKLRLSQGTLSAKRLLRGNVKPVNTIYADHAKVLIDELNWMNLNVFNCPSVNIAKAEAMLITSSISKINMGETGSLVIDSKSDGYTIKSLTNLVSECTYTLFEIEQLNGRLKSKSTYGSINISAIDKRFSSIDISSVQTQVTISPGKDLSFKADIAATDAIVDFSRVKYPKLIKTENNSLVTLTGSEGIDRDTRSQIRIRMTSGKLSIK